MCPDTRFMAIRQCLFPPPFRLVDDGLPSDVDLAAYPYVSCPPTDSGHAKRRQCDATDIGYSETSTPCTGGFSDPVDEATENIWDSLTCADCRSDQRVPYTHGDRKVRSFPVTIWNHLRLSVKRETRCTRYTRAKHERFITPIAIRAHR